MWTFIRCSGLGGGGRGGWGSGGGSSACRGQGRGGDPPSMATPTASIAATTAVTTKPLVFTTDSHFTTPGILNAHSHQNTPRQREAQLADEIVYTLANTRGQVSGEAS